MPAKKPKSQEKGNLAEFLAASPLRGSQLVVERAGRVTAKKRVWVTMPDELLQAAKDVAGKGGLSRFVSECLEERIRRLKLNRAIAEKNQGLFAKLAPDRSLVDELITERRAEGASESAS